MCAGGGSTGSTWDISVLLAHVFYESNTALKNKVNYKENHIHILLVLSVTLITLSVIRFFFFFGQASWQGTCGIENAVAAEVWGDWSYHIHT